MLKKDEVIFLLGAGASFDAGIPVSKKMIEDLERLLNKEPDWTKFQKLYFLIRSAFLYSNGIHGGFSSDGFNIEQLVNILDELKKSDKHPLFPFIGSWTPMLQGIAENNFAILGEFREKIVSELIRWVDLEHLEDANYYKNFEQFASELGFPIRIFSLNYDMCIEKSCQDVERGFDENKIWDWRIFNDQAQVSDKNIYLYKLHGSIDWYRRDDKRLSYRERANKPKDLEIIFGTTYKLQYIDPFLFFAYEFRKWTLSDSRLIACIGYSFSDEHINGILKQALENNSNSFLYIVDPSIKAEEVKNRLNIKDAKRFIIENCGAKDFMENLSVDKINQALPKTEVPF